MSNELIVGDVKINRIEWQGQIVVTAAEIAKYHELDVKVINQKFRRNRNNFILNKDYFVVSTEYLRSHGVTAISSMDRSDEVFLFTESGYLRFVKTINDEKAWQVYNVLIESYFQIKRFDKAEKIFLEKNKEHRKGLTAEWAEHEAKDYKQLTITEYKALFKDISKRKKNMDDKELMLLSAFEFLESINLGNNPEIKGDKLLSNSLLDTGEKINNIIKKKEISQRDN